MKKATAITIKPQTVKNGIITRNATLQIYIPKPHFKGGSVKRYEDKRKVESKEATH